MGGRPGGGLTDGAGHEVDPGGLHLDVEAVAVGHEQPCRDRPCAEAVGRGLAVPQLGNRVSMEGWGTKRSSPAQEGAGPVPLWTPGR